MRRPAARSGELVRKVARLPWGLVLRAHSSAATTTTVLRPFLVMVWGPSDSARWIRVLSLALALATGQVGWDIGMGLPFCGQDGHYSHFWLGVASGE